MATLRSGLNMISGRKAKIILQVFEVSPSDKMIPKKEFLFPEKGYARKGVVASNLLDWLLHNNFCTPGKLMAHGFFYDINRFGKGNKNSFFVIILSPGLTSKT